MKIVKKVVVLLVLFLFLAAPTQAQLFKKGIKIGYVDIAEVFDQYEATDIATEKLRGDIEEKKKDIEKRREDINILTQKLDAQATVINEKEKDKVKKDVESKLKELKDITEKSNRELRQREQKLIRDILKDIEEVIKIYGKDNGYDLVMDKRQVLYGPEGMDITKEIVKIINKRLKKEK